jgi:hypothetical protein
VLAEFIVLFFTSQFIFKSFFSVLHALSHSDKFASGVVSFLFFPGVFIHELAHYLMARILFVKVTKFNMAPQLEGEHLQMGSVEIHKPDRIRNLLIGIAPVITGLLLIYLISRFFLINISLSHAFSSGPTFLKIFGAGVFVFLIANTMFSSKKDLEGWWIILIAFIGVVGLLLLFKVDIWLYLNQVFFNQHIQKGMETFALILAIPVFLNVFVVGMFRLMKRF